MIQETWGLRILIPLQQLVVTECAVNTINGGGCPDDANGNECVGAWARALEMS